MQHRNDPKILSDEALAEAAINSSILVFHRMKEITQQLTKAKQTFVVAVDSLEKEKLDVSDYYGVQIPAELARRKEQYGKALRGLDEVSSKKMIVPDGKEEQGVLEKMLHELKMKHALDPIPVCTSVPVSGGIQAILDAQRARLLSVKETSEGVKDLTS